ncbi:hypothetical protein ACP275_13G196600 [Erythranthe tilingii]
MAYFLHRIIFIALVLAIAVPSSLGWSWTPGTAWGKPEIAKYLKEVCSNTNKTKECWYFIKPQLNRFDGALILELAPIARGLVQEKAHEINDKIDRLYNGSKNENMKNKYLSCSQNYNDAIAYLQLVKISYEKRDYDNILIQIDDAAQELECCSHQFTENSFDPAHVRNRNNEFRIYLEFLKAITNSWVWESRID